MKNAHTLRILFLTALCWINTAHAAAREEEQDHTITCDKFSATLPTPTSRSRRWTSVPVRSSSTPDIRPRRKTSGTIADRIAEKQLQQTTYLKECDARPILLTAVEKSNPEQFRELLKRKRTVNPNFFAYSGLTPLHIAVQNECVEVVELLLSIDAFVNERDRIERLTPLQMAVTSGNVEIATLLLKAGAIVTVRNEEGMQPLNVAYSANNLPLIELLLRYTRGNHTVEVE